MKNKTREVCELLKDFSKNTFQLNLYQDLPFLLQRENINRISRSICLFVTLQHARCLLRI